MKLPIFGTKTVLFPVESIDINYFASIITKDNRKRLVNFKPEVEDNDFEFFFNNLFVNSQDHETYIARITQGKSTRNLGIFYLYKFTPNYYQFIFLPDPNYLQGLKKRLDKDSNPYLEDCLRAFVSSLNVERLECILPSDDKLMGLLLKKVSFSKEGTLKKYATIDGQFYSVNVFGLTKG